jgi:hypothetical protein
MKLYQQYLLEHNKLAENGVLDGPGYWAFWFLPFPLNSIVLGLQTAWNVYRDSAKKVPEQCKGNKQCLKQEHIKLLQKQIATLNVSRSNCAKLGNKSPLCILKINEQIKKIKVKIIKIQST